MQATDLGTDPPEGPDASNESQPACPSNEPAAAGDKQSSIPLQSPFASPLPAQQPPALGALVVLLQVSAGVNDVQPADRCSTLCIQHVGCFVGNSQGTGAWRMPQLLIAGLRRMLADMQLLSSPLFVL